MRCVVCDDEFIYKDIVKSYITNNGDIKCCKCNQEYYIIWYSRLLLSILVFIPFLFTKSIINALGYYSLLVCVIWFGFIYLLMPFITKFKKK